MRSLACFAAALALLMSSADPAAAAAGGASSPRQKRLLEAGKSAFERLRKDDRRRRHRDAWEAVERELDQAVQAAPAGALAPEAALWAAKARAELYESSRVLGDVRAAVAAYRGVDAAHPDSPQGLRALIAGVQLGTRAHEHSETALAARRLAARYPRSPEAKAALALMPAPKRPPPVAPGARPQRPVEVGVDDEEDSDEQTASARAGATRSARRAAKAPAAAAIAAAIAKATAAAAAGSGAEREQKASAPAPALKASEDAAPPSGGSTAAPTNANGSSISADMASAASAASTGTSSTAATNAAATRATAASATATRTATGTATTTAARAATAARAPTGIATATRTATESSRPAASGEPEVDIPREAIHVVEEMVQAARKDGTAQTSASPEPSVSASAEPSVSASAEPSVSASAEPSNDDAGPEPEAPEAPPQRTPGFVRLAREAVARLTEPQEEPDAEDKARELRSVALAGGASIAAQLGLKVRRVVIDPGHGGKDTGAIGPHGVREKDIALAIARRLATRLRGLGFTAVLTRNDDSFLALDERTRIANEAKADLFVSIHCNAARQRKLSGIETWTLNVASDRYATRLAAFENAEAERTVSDLRLILADLATKSNAGDARELAQSVQSSLVRNLRSRVGRITDHGVKQALFYVLLGTHMPSILVETAFLSNPSEEARLRSAKYQEAAAEAIARGVKDFVDGRQRLARAP